MPLPFLFILQPKLQRERERERVDMLFYCLLLSLLLTIPSSAEASPMSFIVLVDSRSKPHPFLSHLFWYTSLLSTSSSSSPVIHAYTNLLDGFSATLTPDQARQLRAFPGVRAVVPDPLLHPHTTRSPTFLGLGPPSPTLFTASRGGSATVIGFIDSGIWPEHPSFSDLGLGPVPARWRGECEEGHRFNRSNCNRKLIGARYFTAGYSASFPPSAADFLSPRDSDGHGTHVASIAAGSHVPGANLNGFASGVARGMAPMARIAAYKACWAAGCLLSDVAAALERAVSDGVDVVSLSVGSSSPAPSYDLDPLAIATFRASLRGVFVAASAGNGGPAAGSIANAPPWITTVGAGTIDRDFPAFVHLGNGQKVRGVSITVSPNRLGSPHPLLYAGKITDAASTNLTVRGRIVVWEADRHVSRVEIGAALKRTGAVGMVVSHGDVDPWGFIAEPHMIPTVAIGADAAAAIVGYIRSFGDPSAALSSMGTVLLPPGAAPVVASFSARGPNAAVPWAMKPDILAPGVSILGGWTGEDKRRRSGFSVESGTSMACPHVAGVAALVRAVRPEWTPWEVRSALMSTAAAEGVRDESESPAAAAAGAFGMGAGHLWPDRAWDPGLVYDLEYEDYVGFLCGLGYGDEEIRAVGGRDDGGRCRSRGGRGVYEYNYPGFVVVEEEGMEEVVFYRRVKRIDGGSGCWYRAEVAAPAGYAAEVSPERIWFGGAAGERVGFRMALRRAGGGGGDGSGVEEGELLWREEGGNHTVRSPIVVVFSGTGDGYGVGPPHGPLHRAQFG